MLILLGLGVLWAAVLLPPLVRRSGAGSSTRPLIALPSVGALNPSGFHALKRTAAEAPNSARAARRRRRDVLIALGGVAVMTFLFALAVGSIMWMAHFLADVALVGYATLLTMRHQRSMERPDVVIPFRPSSAMVPDLGIAMRDEAVLRRQAN
ncbi:MAG: hypothetical protein HN567_04425 [Actinobacteria bacterium]|nr:hypothetical protein [Actinomycetota bacterium]MBT6970456.1 hypothetical protein [Actinomycetota bacterium]MBT7379726.1 hypothetical protein [Actinomycetota bacterium]MBT7868545.1 hypothetical protein [Actinomycetota bacterium]